MRSSSYPCINSLYVTSATTSGVDADDTAAVLRPAIATPGANPAHDGLCRALLDATDIDEASCRRDASGRAHAPASGTSTFLSAARAHTNLQKRGECEGARPR